MFLPFMFTAVFTYYISIDYSILQRLEASIKHAAAIIFGTVVTVQRYLMRDRCAIIGNINHKHAIHGTDGFMTLI